jgi:hypothetical protein
MPLVPTYASRLIGVKTPPILLPFPNFPSDFVVMFNFHTFILFNLPITPFLNGIDEYVRSDSLKGCVCARILGNAFILGALRTMF